ncbi:MAG: SGNH/GDSL hydrolase family protein [Bacteroidales bacterium]|nr:SGNH/GDSL hydrolase family protein [Candidatus Sodaliphilus aphodohippi]
MKKHLLLLVALFITNAFVAIADDELDWALTFAYAEENTELKAQSNNGKRVVLLGNSITEGWYDKHPEFFERTGFIGRGISGQTSYHFLIRFREDVLNLNPAVVVINAGTNDIAENNGHYVEDVTMENIISMVELAQAHKIKVVLTTVLPSEKMYWHSHVTNIADKIASLNKRIEAYAKKNGIQFIDYYTPMVYGENRCLNPAYSKDGVHPTIEGYAVMEAILEKALKKYVKK